MAEHSYFRLQLIVFALVSATFTNIYITQAVLPILQKEFSVDMVLVSFTWARVWVNEKTSAAEHSRARHVHERNSSFLPGFFIFDNPFVLASTSLLKRI